MNNKMKILIIEDDRIQAEDIKEQLEEFGYEIIGPAYESIQAIYLFKTQKPDLALVDIALEGSSMDGIEIVKQLKKINKIPIIFLSGNHDDKIREKVKKINPNYFLTKPVLTHQLDIAIDFALYNFMIEQGQKQIESNVYLPDSLKKDYVFIKQRSNYTKINLHDINYVKASNYITELYLNYKTYIVTTNISDFLDKINVNYIVRTNRSYAVNIYSIQSFDYNKINIINNKKIAEIPISSTYRQDFLDMINVIKTN